MIHDGSQNYQNGTVRRWKSTHNWDSERSDKKSERSKKKTSIKKQLIQEEVKAVLENDGLTDKQKLFCIYFVKSFNATKAYEKAYECDYRTALCAGPRLLGNDRVKAEINNLEQAN